MRLTDIPLGWTLVAVALVGVATAVTVLARQRASAGRKDKAAITDSWERSEERRRRKEAVYGMASYALLFCCAAVAAALSFHGLVGFGRQNLDLSGGWEYLVPFGLDGAAMFCSVLAVREASHGDAALGSRMLVWLFAGAAAWFNWVHAPRGGDHAGAPQFFAGMSLSAAVLFDRALKQTRRAALRDQGLVPRPLPQIRIVRWLRAPRETYAAWSLMLLENVRSLDEAVEEVREDRVQKQQSRQRRRDQERLDRARIRAYNRQHRGLWGRRGGRQVDVPALAAPPASQESVVAERQPERLAGRAPRPALRSGTGSPAGEGGPAAAGTTVRAGSVADADVTADAGAPGGPARPHTIDLTAEDDTLTIPRLDSLEEKLAEIERAFG